MNNTDSECLEDPDRQTDRQTERWRCTDGECLEDPVHLDVFTGRQVVIDVLIETFKRPHRVLFVVFIRRVFALNKLPATVHVAYTPHHTAPVE